MYNPLDPAGSSHDNSLEGEEDDEDDDKPAPSATVLSQHKVRICFNKLAVSVCHFDPV